MNRLLRAAFLTLFVCLAHQNWATHIVGAELYYTCINSTIDSSTFDIDLKLYRDCGPTSEAPFDPTIYLFIFNANTGALEQTVPVFVPPVTPQIQPNDWSACVGTTPSICVEEGIYETTIILENNADGHDIAWSRCCRNAAIDNLSTPLQEGITFLARVPPSLLGTNTTCNSMPQFDQLPPVFLCANETFTFDHSATDVDGDSLVYALTNPYTGTNFQGLGTGNPNFPGGNNPSVDPFGNLMGPPPYNTVNFATGYSFQDPFGSGNFVIDPQTGFITVTPNQTGIFVFSISVFEYRNGNLLSENRRDFQIHVLNCLPQGSPPQIAHDLTGLNTSGDTIFVEGGEPFCYDVTITDSVPTANIAAFTVSAVFGNGIFFPPAATFTFSGTNPINGQVCWEPSCAYDGIVVPLVIGATDLDACDNFGDVFDTVWVSISVPPNQPPVITPDLTGLNSSNDTIFVEPDGAFCIDYTVTDVNPNDILEAFPQSPIFSDPTNPPTFTFSGTNPLNVQVCWTPGCDLDGQVIAIDIGASDSSECNSALGTSSVLYIDIKVPPNTPPAIATDLSGNIFSNDTIEVEAEDDLCFTFIGTDPDASDDLTLNLISAIFTDPNGPTVNTNGTNPLTGDICWTPGCQFEGQVIELIFEVEDPVVCGVSGTARDTVYIDIKVPDNIPPTISTDLSGNTVNGDTIFIFANDGLCFNFTGNDVNGGDLLTAFAQSPIVGQPGGPVLTTTPGNPVQGQICWTPSCDFVGDLVEIIIGVQDDAACSAQGEALDTVYVQIDLPPNDPPTASHDLSGLETNGDTILILANDPFCYSVSFNDINVQDSLTFFTVSPIFSSINPPSISISGNNPMQAQICWTPTCDNEGQLIELIVGVEDNGECDNNLQALDTVYVRIVVPLTIPPVIATDLSSNPSVSGDTIYITIEDEACYTFYIADLTPEMGIDYTYEFEDQFGNALSVTEFTINPTQDTIFGSVCFEADCSNGGSLYRSIVTGFDLKECPPFESTSDTVFIKVNTDFASFAGADTFFCAGSGGVQIGAIPIGGEAPYFYQWGCDDPGNCGFTNSNSNDQNPTVNPNQTTTYFVQITDVNGCTSEFDDITVVVNPLPIADAGPDQIICREGNGVRLQASVVNETEAPGPYTYEWIPANNLSDPTVVDPFATPDTTTIYTLIVGSSNGCTSDITTLDTVSTVRVSVNPTPEVEAGPDRDLCFGDTLKLEGFASGAGPDYDFVWTPSINVADSSEAVTNVSPELTTTYYLIAISNGCPSNADSMTVNVRSIPTVNVASPQYEVCALDSVRLLASASGEPSSDSYTYTWLPNTGLNDPTGEAPNASPDSTLIYQVVASSIYGCESLPRDVPVTVLPTPVAALPADTAVCGTPVNWTLNSTYTIAGGETLNGPVFYEWTPSAGLSSLISPSPIAAPEQTTQYFVTIRSGSCETTDSIFIEVYEPIEIAVVADTNRICSADSLLLFAEGGRGSTSFNWAPGADASDSSAQSTWVSPNETTDYILTAREGICVARDTFSLRVNPTPEADYFVSQTEGCTDLMVYFEANTTDAIAYIWDFGDGKPLTNEKAPQHTYTVPGSYPVTLTAIGEGGCVDSITRSTITVVTPGDASFTTEPSIPADIVLPDAAIQGFDASFGAEKYFWDFGDGGFSEEVNPQHLYQEPGEFQVSLTITDAGGCTDTYVLGPVRVLLPDVRIPNVFTPNADGYNDEYRVTYTGKSRFSLEIVDRWGRQMYLNESAPLPGWNGLAPNGSPADEGVYFYIVRIGEDIYRGSLTLLR